MFENIINDPFYSQKYEINILSRPGDHKGDEDGIAQDLPYQIGPWVLTLDNFVSPEEAEEMIALGAAIGYERSTDVGEIESNGAFERVVSETRTSTNAWCTTDECNDNAAATAIYDRIQNLTQISPDKSEPFQMLRYEVGQFYGA